MMEIKNPHYCHFRRVPLQQKFQHLAFKVVEQHSLAAWIVAHAKGENRNLCDNFALSLSSIEWTIKLVTWYSLCYFPCNTTLSLVSTFLDNAFRFCGSFHTFSLETFHVEIIFIAHIWTQNIRDFWSKKRDGEKMQRHICTSFGFVMLNIQTKEEKKTIKLFVSMQKT